MNTIGSHDTDVEVLEFYKQHSPITDPGKHTAVLWDIPRDVSSLCNVVQGLLIHASPFWGMHYGYSIPSEREQEYRIRNIAAKLDKILTLDPRPLTETRPFECRLVSNCRDYALLLVAFLRHNRIPARVRYGFAAYFGPIVHEDHVIAEYWNFDQQKWVMVDPQLDALQCDLLKVNFDPCDVPPERFIMSGSAWVQCRSGIADPDNFGYTADRIYSGIHYVQSQLVKDTANLNKIEILGWDSWGLAVWQDTPLTNGEFILLDRVAQFTLAGNDGFAKLRELYLEDQRLRVPHIVKSYFSEDIDDYKMDHVNG